MRLTIILSVEDIMRDEIFEEADVLIDVERAMTRLTHKQREALNLWLQGYTQKEIGERLGIGQRSVGDRIAAGLKRLKRLVEYL